MGDDGEDDGDDERDGGHGIVSGRPNARHRERDPAHPVVGAWGLLTPCSPCLPVYIPRSLLHLFTPQHCDSRIHKWTDPWGTGNWWTTDWRQLLVLLGVLVNSVSSQFSLPSLCHFCRGSLRRVSLVPTLNRTSHVGRTCLLYQLRITSSPFPSFCSSSFF